METQEILLLLQGYRRAAAMADPYRYTNHTSIANDWPGVFSVDFESMLKTKPEEMPEKFIKQEHMASALRNLMTGKTLTEEEYVALGVTESELLTIIREIDPCKKRIPENLVVLCFDDAIKSQFTHARNILKEFGFNASFFVTEMGSSPRGNGFEDKSRFMTWDEIKILESEGFEIANHSLHHAFDAYKRGAQFAKEELLGMEARFAEKGLKKPITYAYPGGCCNYELMKVCRDCGYKWARGNCADGPNGVSGMTYYDPHLDSPLSICSYGDPDFYTAEILRSRIAETPKGNILSLTYHDVAPESWLGPCSFEQQMYILKETGCKVISVAELEEYIDPEKAYQYTR